MLTAARLAADVGKGPGDLPVRLEAILSRIGLPTSASDLVTTDLLLESMRLDKKVADGRIRIVLPDNMGSVVIDNTIEESSIRNAWETLRSS